MFGQQVLTKIFHDKKALIFPCTTLASNFSYLLCITNITFDSNGVSRFLSVTGESRLNAQDWNFSGIVADDFTYGEGFDFMNGVISAAEVRLHRLSLKPRKGAIGLRPDHLIHLQCDSVDQVLSCVFTDYFTQHYLPMAFRTATIHPLFKGSGKDDRLPVSYRDISLGHVLAKLLDVCMTQRIEIFLTHSDSSIHASQFGGRKSHSCIMQIIRATEYLSREISHMSPGRGGSPTYSNHVALTLLDVCKAFTRVSRLILVSTFMGVGIEGHLLAYIAAFLTDRRQCTRVDGCLSDVSVPLHGVPQGFQISLLGFLLYIDSSVACFRHAIPGLYVDDIFAIFSSSRPSDLIKRMVEDFGRVYTWGVQRQMIFDASKFNLINCHLGKHLERRHKLAISFGDTTPEWTTDAKLLGVLFDSKLSFKSELSRIAEKAYGATFRIFNHVDWHNGLGVSKLLEIYFTWLKPIISYGCPVWIFQIFSDIRLSAKPNHGYDDKFWSLIHRDFRAMMRGIAGVSRRTNLTAVLVRLGVLPLHYSLALQAMSEYYRIYTNQAGEAMSKLLQEMKQGDAWTSTRFLAAADRNISYFQTFAEEPLLHSETRQIFSKRLRRAMYAELTAA